ncbi:MAG: serine/threonine protein kinase [Candidatus Obscuribacterales bacterium]|nr:serine/threonine protein kinase [Candidatus Obscuribacterales bacterium]
MLPLPNEETPAALQELALQIPNEYKVIEFLGEGGHGIVLKAFFLPMQMPVALKIIKTDSSDDTLKQIKRMQNEAKILAKLSHTNIVKVFQMGACKDSTPFLVCEFLEGVTLAQYLSRNSQPSPRRILEIFTQILDALTFAHEHGLLHRDLKPSNVMILTDHESGDLQIKLLDFGIARDFTAEQSSTMGLTRTIQITGSAPYMSPEQCKGETVDQRSDLYSVACMLYECLAGTPPFVGETPMHTRYLQINQAVQIPSTDKYAHTASRAAAYKLALQCLSKDKNLRPSSAKDLKELLQRAMPNASKRSDWTIASKSSQKLFITATISTIAALLIAAWFTTSSQKKQSTSTTPNKSIKTSKLSPLSKAVAVKGLIQEVIAYNHERTANSAKAGIALQERLKELISNLRPDEKPMAYQAWKSKGILENKLDFLREAEKSWSTALSFCKDSSGKSTREAVQCLNELAKIKLKEENLQEAERFANEDVALCQDLKVQMRALELPTLLDDRDDFSEGDSHEILGTIAEHRQDFKTATKEYETGEKLKRTEEDFVKSTVILVKQAEAMIVLGEKNNAEKLLEQRAKELYLFGKDDPKYVLDTIRNLEKHPVLNHFPELKKKLGRQFEEIAALAQKGRD